jgi:hypothetical protein
MINRLLTMLTEELRDEGLPDPLGASFTLAALWDDLPRLTGETPPTAVQQRFEADSPLTDPSGWGDLLTGPAPTAPPPIPL